MSLTAFSARWRGGAGAGAVEVGGRIPDVGGEDESGVSGRDCRECMVTAFQKLVARPLALPPGLELATFAAISLRNETSSG